MWIGTLAGQWTWYDHCTESGCEQNLVICVLHTLSKMCEHWEACKEDIWSSDAIGVVQQAYLALHKVRTPEFELQCEFEFKFKYELECWSHNLCRLETWLFWLPSEFEILWCVWGNLRESSKKIWSRWPANSHNKCERWISITLHKVVSLLSRISWIVNANKYRVCIWSCFACQFVLMWSVTFVKTSTWCWTPEVKIDMNSFTHWKLAICTQFLCLINLSSLKC